METKNKLKETVSFKICRRHCTSRQFRQSPTSDATGSERAQQNCRTYNKLQENQYHVQQTEQRYNLSMSTFTWASWLHSCTKKSKGSKH